MPSPSARELVALVSSCSALPWMIEVADSLAYLRTRFHTLITSPQVVSTIWQPRSLICCRVESSVPNAGTITTSSGCRSAMSACLFFPIRFLMPNEEICSLTSGL